MFLSLFLIRVPSLLFQEEEDIFCVLWFIGKSHGNFFAKLEKEFAQEVQHCLFYFYS